MDPSEGSGAALAAFMACIMFEPAVPNNLMNNKNLMILGLFGIAAVALVGLYLSLRDEEEHTPSFDVPWTGTEDLDDPFQGWVEEGAGLIGQLKAEAAERARAHQKA